MATRKKNSDERLRKTAGEDRAHADRQNADLERENATGLSLDQEERRRMFREEWLQEALPKPPDILGWHTCWLSTTNSYDPIHKRLRLGYVPVRPSEIPGFEKLVTRSADYGDCVTCNEMILFKIPVKIWQEIMEEFHHYMPMEEEGKIRAQVDQLKEGMRDQRGNQVRVFEEDGMREIGVSRKAPTFTP